VRQSVSEVAIGREFRPRFSPVQKSVRVQYASLFFPFKSRLSGLRWGGWLLGCMTIVAAMAQPVDPARTLPETQIPVLAEILTQALRQSPQMLLQNLDVVKAEANRLYAAHELWPSVGGDMRYEVNAVATTASAPQYGQGFFYNIGLQQNIFQWGAVKAAADIGALQLKIAQKQYADAYSALVVQLRRQFLDLILQKKNLQIKLLGLQNAETSFAADQERLAHGEISPGDFGNIKLVLDEQRLAIARSRSEFAQNKRLFMRVAGLKELADERIPDTVPAPNWTEDQVAQLVMAFTQADGVSNTPQIQVLTNELRSRELEYRIAKVRLLPKFSFSIGANLQNLTSASAGRVSQTATTDRHVGVVANWTLFDGFWTRSAKLSALANKRQTERKLQSQLESIEESVRNQSEQVNFAAQAMKFSEQRYIWGTEGLKYVEGEVKEHRAASSAAEQARVGVLSAEWAAQNNRADLYKRWSELVALLWVDPMLQNLPASYLNHDK
jgi:outer membrane protein TolC